MPITPKVFQKTNKNNLQNLNIVDDYIIAEEIEQENKGIMKKIVERSRQFNVKFYWKKVQYKVNEVKYLAKEFSAEEEKLDSDYIKAALNLEGPTNKKELLSVLSIVNYLIKYIPDLSQIKSTIKNFN